MNLMTPRWMMIVESFGSASAIRSLSPNHLELKLDFAAADVF